MPLVPNKNILRFSHKKLDKHLISRKNICHGCQCLYHTTVPNVRKLYNTDQCLSLCWLYFVCTWNFTFNLSLEGFWAGVVLYSLTSICSRCEVFWTKVVSLKNDPLMSTFHPRFLVHFDSLEKVKMNVAGHTQLLGAFRLSKGTRSTSHRRHIFN